MPDPRVRGNVNRRGLLDAAARLALAGVAAAGAGCTEPADTSGPRTPPQSPEGTPGGPGLVVTDFADVEAEDGTLHVRVTVENRGAEAIQGTLVVEAAAGDDSETVSRDVAVAPGERTDVVVETSLSYEAFGRQGSLRVYVE